MTTLREAAQQALEALEWASDLNQVAAEYKPMHEAIASLRAALAEPVQEPVAIHQWRKSLCAEWYDGHPDHSDGGGPYETRTLYAAPPQRGPLTDEEIEQIADGIPVDDVVGPTTWHLKLARAIERAHGIGEQ